MRAPFPYFGGKRKAAELVWERFDPDVPNYVEPFAGGLGVLLGRPAPARIETVNDKSRFISNFWRAVQHDPDAVAAWADWPVNEVDLHARHRWLITEGAARLAGLEEDPDKHDPQVAGWWVWGICQWIGGGWCSGAHEDDRRPALAHPMGVHKTPRRSRPKLGGNGVGVGVHAKRPVLDHPRGLYAQVPDLSHRHGRGLYRRQPNVYRGDGRGVVGHGKRGELVEVMRALQERLRNVRVCSGDWTRVVGPTPTFHIGTTAVFLDPPYDQEMRDNRIYAVEERGVAAAAREWAVANGGNPKLRIALCGFEDEHAMPPGWEMVRWRGHGGYAHQARGAATRGKTNIPKDVIWFSPHCLKPSRGVQASLPLEHHDGMTA